MRQFLLKRFLSLIATLVVASFVIFMAINLAPGDPATRLAGNHATAHQIATIRAQLGLDRPVLARYFSWLWGALHANLGTSYQYNESVTSLIGARIGESLLLIAFASLEIVLAGYLLGILGGGVKRLAVPVAILNSLMIAVPSFIAATLLISLFSLRLNWFPAIGDGSGFADTLYHLTLPATALAIGWSAYIAQITRSALRNEASSEHVETARVRGLEPGAVFRRHVLRNAAAPMITVTGLSIGGMLVGTVVVEQAFGLSGVGSLLVGAVAAKDDTLTEGLALLFVVVFVVINTLADLLQAALDPRVRLKAA